MKWTSEKPKEAGWYWMRADISGEGIEGVRYCEKVVCLWETAVGLFVGNHGYLQDVEGGEWYGPISPTDRQQGRVEGLVRGAQLVRWHKSCAFEADPAFALERAAKDIESVASQIIQPQQAQEGGVGEL